MDVEVAPAPTAQVGHAETPDPLDEAVLGARCDRQTLRPLQRVDLGLGAEGRLGHADRQVVWRLSA